MSGMDVVVVYESMFGNTRTVAADIAAGVRDADPGARVELVPVAQATPARVGTPDLLVVGGPTHIMRMTSARTRHMGVESLSKPRKDGKQHQALQPDAAGPGIREWLKALPRARAGSRAAAFDTRLAYPMAGGAARPIAQQLRKHGYQPAGHAAGFVVTDAEGPLRDGERDRARAWGGELARLVHV
jgi:hypothetical protein